MEARLVDLGDLPEYPIMWDVGAFKGEWAKDITERYPKSCIELFEPVPDYALSLDQKGFLVRPYGLSDHDHAATIKIAGDRSSTYDIPQDGQGKVEIQIKDVSAVLGDQKLDVMKINVEGAEYPIMERLLDTGQIYQVRTFLIQFHTFIPSFGERYLSIKKCMQHTHALQWRTPFVWERWDKVNL